MPVQILTGLQKGLHTDALLGQLLKDRGVPRDFSYPHIMPAVSVTKLTDLVGSIDVANQLQLFDGGVGHDGLPEPVSFNVGAQLRYVLQEFEFRFNNRENPFLFRDTVLALIKGETLPMKKLTAS